MEVSKELLEKWREDDGFITVKDGKTGVVIAERGKITEAGKEIIEAERLKEDGKSQ